MRELVLHKVEGLEHQHKGIGGRRRGADLMPWLEDDGVNFSCAEADSFLNGDGIAKAGISILTSVLDREAHEGYEIARHPDPVAEIFIGAVTGILILDLIVRKIRHRSNHLLAARLQGFPCLLRKCSADQVLQVSALAKGFPALHKLQEDAEVIEARFKSFLRSVQDKRAIAKDVSLMTGGVSLFQVFKSINCYQWY